MPICTTPISPEPSLWGAQLSGARIEHAVGITEEQLKNAHRA